MQRRRWRRAATYQLCQELREPPEYSKGGCLVAVQRPDGHVETDCLREQTKVSGQDHGISRPSGIQD